MPIERREFEATGAVDRRWTDDEPTPADRVLTFLSDNAEQAFTATEIREALALPRGSIGVALTRLEDAGLVRHRGGYWGIAPRPETEADGQR